ncbi:MAG: hypothetical protein Q4A32_07595 [Lachnospiraceae bacterium]|nr:hypothetical protein [Lachnospiraceae bacterium]
MNEKELKKLSREDLLEMLVSQTKEVERLQEEKKILISQLGSLKDGFKKAGALEFALGQMGVPVSNVNPGIHAAAIDEVIARHT